MSATSEIPVTTTIVRDNTVPPTVGKIVLYTLSTVDTPVAMGEVRPAIVVSVDGGIEDAFPVTLQVFTKGGYDQLLATHPVKARYSADGEQGAWSWPAPSVLVFSQKFDEAPESKDTLDKLEADIQKRLDAHIEKKGYAVSEGDKADPQLQPNSKEVVAQQKDNQLVSDNVSGKYPSKSPSAYPAPEPRTPSKAPPK